MNDRFLSLCAGLCLLILLAPSGISQQNNKAKRPPLGTLLNKPGAVKGNRSWDNAWQFESPNFRIKTNISPKAAREIALVMEALQQNFQRLFDASIYQKIDVLVAKNRSDFASIRRVPKQNRGWFTPRNGGKVVTYYQPGEHFNTTRVLLHEGTHMVVMLALTDLNIPDIWVNEGIAVYFEASRFDGPNMVIGMKPRNRLRLVKKLIETDQYTSIEQLIHLSKSNFTARHYAEAWSLVHYLIHANDNQYVNQFDRYILSFKNNPNMSRKKRFLGAFQRPIEEIEKEWKQYVKDMSLEGEDVVKIGEKRGH